MNNIHNTHTHTLSLSYCPQLKLIICVYLSSAILRPTLCIKTHRCFAFLRAPKKFNAPSRARCTSASHSLILARAHTLFLSNVLSGFGASDLLHEVTVQKKPSLCLSLWVRPEPTSIQFSMRTTNPTALAFICICMYTHTHTRSLSHTLTHTHTYTHNIHNYTYIYTCICICKCVYIFVHIHTGQHPL
jgi:hypothetical protein